jgi:hypothetical protein
MSELQQWADRWSIPPECLADLVSSLTRDAGTGETGGQTEAWAQSAVRLEAPRFGVWLTRNNVGARTITEDDGKRRHIRWGLANETPAQNKVLKSADLIGIRPVTITPAHVGSTIGQFVSRECKRPGWVFSGDAHEQAQLNWQLLILKHGGDARFTTGPGSFG